MKKSPHKRKSSKSVFQNPVVVGAIITGIAAILTTWLTVLPNLRSQRPQEVEPPAAGAVIAVQPSFTAEMPTLEPTRTATPVLIVSTDTPTLTPTPRPVSLTCLEGWWLIMLPKKLDYEQEAREGCAASNYRGLGFSTSSDGFQITLDKSKVTGTYGISTGPLPENAVIRMKVKVSILYTAEFWVGLSNSKNPDPDVLILAMDPAASGQNIPPGSIRIYKNNFDTKLAGYNWPVLDPSGGQSNRAPFIYDLQFTVSGGNVEIRVNNIPLTSQIVNFPRYLFLGFRNKSTQYSATVYVTVTNLQIEPGE
jgi:hypothetical protein